MAVTEAAPPHRPGRSLAVDLGLLALASLPLLLVQYLPLHDLPNHMARLFILRAGPDAEFLFQYYAVIPKPVPNLAFDAVALALAPAFGIEGAVRAFCLLCLAMYFLGARWATPVEGGRRASAYRLAPFLFYGGPFLLGFMSFCFGVGLAIVLFAAYRRLRGGSAWRSILFLAGGGLLLVASHLVAFGLWAIAIAVLEADLLLGVVARIGLRAALPRVRVVALLLLCGLVPPLLIVAAAGSRTAVPAHFRWGGLWDKAEGLFALTMFADPARELALLALALAAVAAFLLLRIWRPGRMALLLVAAIGLAYLALPRAAGGTSYIDYRLPWGAAPFLLASLLPGAASGARQQAANAAVAALVGARIALVLVQWLAWSPILAGIDTALQALPRGARLYVVEGDAGSTSRSRSPTLGHVTGYAVMRREALWPLLFADIPGHMLSVREPYRRGWVGQAPPTLTQLDALYDHVAVLRPESARIAPTLPLRCLAASPMFELLEVVPPGTATGRCSGR